MRTTTRVIWAACLAASSCSLAIVVPAQVASAGPAAAPATYTVVSGDTLWGIAARMKTSFQSLLDTNKLTPTSVILPGRKLLVPAGGVTPKPRPATTSGHHGGAGVDQAGEGQHGGGDHVVSRGHPVRGDEHGDGDVRRGRR